MAESRLMAPSKDKLTVRMLQVGHGDSFLLQWSPHDGKPWTILIDGGPRRNEKSLKDHLADARASIIDRLILTHVDADHLDGLASIGDLPVTEYWGPCLPAFRRYEWLFPDRVQKALQRAAQFEAHASTTGTKILYPVEGYRDRSPDGRLSLRLLSPAPQLINRLLWADDAVELFRRYPTPMGWLLTGQIDEQEHGAEVAESLIRQSVIEPAQLGDPRPATRDGVDALAEANRWASEYGQNPEFFGNSVLNDTSLVVLITVDFDNQHRRRLLFPGDLENWFYLIAIHQAELACDVIKAPHHGGRVFIEDHRHVAFDEIYQTARPKVVFASGCGKHDLPREHFREAVLRWGGCLLCASQRSKETIIGREPDAISCFDGHACTLQPTLSLEMTADECFADRPACVGAPGTHSVPIVVLKQHVIDPSPLLDQFTEGELHKHTNWIVKLLKDVHEKRKQIRGTGDHKTVDGRYLIDNALADGRHLLAAEMASVLERAKRQGRVWCEKNYHKHEVPTSYIVPTHDEMQEMNKWLDGRKVAFFELAKEAKAPMTAEELLSLADTGMVEVQVAQQFGFPNAGFRDMIWPSFAKIISSKWLMYIHRPILGRSILSCFHAKNGAPLIDALKDALVLNKGNGYRLGVDWRETASKGLAIALEPCDESDWRVDDFIRIDSGVPEITMSKVVQVV